MLGFLRNQFADIRLALAALGGGLIYVAMPAFLPRVMRGAIGWDGGALLFLVLTVLAVGRATPEKLSNRASQQDSKMWIILALIATAAAASLASLAFVMQKGASAAPTPLLGRILVSSVTIFVSWIFVHTTFAIRYAHYFYGDPGAKGRHRGGLVFPGTEHPDLWDFIYYSFVVGMTCQVSDVQITSRAMRKLTLAHGVFAFFFNAGVLALAVNILATAL
ncbi:MAG TPA: DUF1345 domain-containing protein [Stellaceae bacterium]|nr:DUF1345 domain-containing protein [Stellaceae bacterium]